LQWWGTEYRRSQSPTYWIDKVAAILQAHGGSWVISDVRMPNEAEMIQRIGGRVWRIDREVQVYGIPGHISERIDRLPYDVLIENNGSLDQLSVLVDAAV
jgi:hypothetical protein